MRRAIVPLLLVAAILALGCWNYICSEPPPAASPAGGPAAADGPPVGLRLPSPPLLEALDANHDGELASAELAGAASGLKTLDKDNDGELSETEVGTSFLRDGRRPGGFRPPGGPGGFGGPGGPGPGGFGGPGGPGPGGPGGFGTARLLDRFDSDKDGMLNLDERAQARAFVKQTRPAGRGMFGPGPSGPFGGPEADTAEGSAPRPGPRLSPDQVTHYPDADLYDPQVLRTLFFVFENQDWEQELDDFHHADVEVPATLIVDGKTFANVGMRFRGNSSLHVPRGKKRSFNVSIDLADKKQRLLGCKTLNLLNSHTDPSFLRTVLYNHIARDYVPAPQANLVRVVINGESWGVFANEEQFNKDLVQKWFGEGDGPRWKVPPNFSGAAALVYHGDNAEDYRGLYELKAKDEKQAWQDLIGVCRQLEQLPDEQLETELDRVLNVDRALWFLALDNVLMDDDGYFSRGSDYSIYQDSRFKRFHVLPRDSNETFRFHGGSGGPGGPGGGGPGGGFGPPGGGFGPPGGGFGPPGGGFGGPGDGFGGPGGGPPVPDDGTDLRFMFDLLAGGGPGGFGGPGGGPGGPGGPPGGPGGGLGGPEGGATLDPLSMSQSNVRPLIRRLLSNDHLRARYLAHVQTIVDQWLDWKTLGPVFEDFRLLIAEDVLSDTHNLSTFAEFFDADIAEPAGGGPFGNPPGLKRFVEERRKFLLEHVELAKPRPAILSVDGASEPQAGSPVRVVAQVAQEVPVATVLMYYAVGRGAPFQTTEMKAGLEQRDAKPNARLYVADIPGAAAGAEVFYYIEARAEQSIGTTTFSPARTELGALHYRVSGAAAAGEASVELPALVINELMASNTRTIQNSEGQFADWIELANVGKLDLDLSGLYLTDDGANPRKWMFPSGTKLQAGEYAIVWADEEGKAISGLHANFKLSKTGETLTLVDSDRRGNAVIDAVEFGVQRDDISFGRYPDGQEKWQPLPPTPGKPNVDR